MRKRFIYEYDGPGGMECGYWEDEEKIYPLVDDLIKLLEIEEESDEGTRFRPNRITSCRAMDGHNINEIINRLKVIVELHNKDNEWVESS